MLSCVEHEPLQKIGREELDCYRLSEDGKDFLEEVFECRIDLRKEINELSLLVEDDEEIISYATSHTPFLSLHKTEKDYVLVKPLTTKVASFLFKKQYARS